MNYLLLTESDSSKCTEVYRYPWECAMAILHKALRCSKSYAIKCLGWSSTTQQKSPTYGQVVNSTSRAHIPVTTSIQLYQLLRCLENRTCTASALGLLFKLLHGFTS
ncbi:hypothetical protein [Ranid herpesvirus 3]|uniref:Uncharacterized protein n=1 Tax=Ranid herpesvirus 3 TaxID=1987509 RepID=A0A1X9T5F0_9VIRU|nr:hypothetical protein [Ranid herpesvirus 3]ARR28929.1 hypothetical protein [Ranid herpesvirus 3]